MVIIINNGQKLNTMLKKMFATFSFHVPHNRSIATEIIERICQLWKDRLIKSVKLWPDVSIKKSTKIHDGNNIKDILEKSLSTVLSFESLNKLNDEEQNVVLDNIANSLSHLAEQYISNYTVDIRGDQWRGSSKESKSKLGLSYSYIDRYEIYQKSGIETTEINFPEVFKNQEIIEKAIFEAIKHMAELSSGCSIEMNSM